jgi:hypothetical protein
VVVELEHELWLVVTSKQGILTRRTVDRSDHVRLVYQPPVSSTFLSEQTSHQQPASSTFLSNKPAISNQPTVLFSHNKPAPAIDNQSNEQTEVKEEE